MTSPVDSNWVEAQRRVLRTVITPTIVALVEGAEDHNDMQVVALGLVAEVASLCLHRIIGVPGQGSIESVAAIDPEDALWCLEAVANLRCDDIKERARTVLSLPRREL